MTSFNRTAEPRTLRKRIDEAEDIYAEALREMHGIRAARARFDPASDGYRIGHSLNPRYMDLLAAIEACRIYSWREVSTAVENQAIWRRDSRPVQRSFFCHTTGSLFGQEDHFFVPTCALDSRCAQRRSRRPEGHRVAARSVLDGREHDGTFAAGGRM
jgi:hypothetical protein